MSQLPVLPIEVTIDSINPENFVALVAALERLAMEKVSFRVASSKGQITLMGEEERQLVRVIGRLRNECGIEFHLGAPQVAYRETLSKRVEINYTHKRMSDGASQFAKVRMLFEPAARGAGSSFESTVKEGSIPAQWIAGIEKGVHSVLPDGCLHGFPIVDVRSRLIDAAYHDVDSSALVFEIAARAAFREAFSNSGALLEPIMMVEILSPPEHLAAVTSDLFSRGGQALRQEVHADFLQIDALAPLANMFGYETSPRMAAGRRGSFTMQFDHYDFVGGSPDDLPPAAAVALRG
jgi:elongation factor G